MAVTSKRSPYGIELPHRPSSRKAVPSGGATTTYFPPPEIVRVMRDIDPHLALEWRPHGQWWDGWAKPKGAELGCWRVVIVGESGRTRGIRLWPPHHMDGRFIHWLREFWEAKLFRLRGRGWSDQDARDLMAAQASEDRASEEARFMEKWKRADHSALRHAVKKDIEPPKWRSNHQVGDTLTPAVAP